MPNTNRSVGPPNSEELRILSVEGQTRGGAAPSALFKSGHGPQGPVAQVKYLHLTWERGDRGQGSVI